MNESGPNEDDFDCETSSDCWHRPERLGPMWRSAGFFLADIVDI
jgi:hypothetical protein